eukprot:sb/3472295/
MFSFLAARSWNKFTLKSITERKPVCEIDLGRCATSISLRLPCSQPYFNMLRTPKLGGGPDEDEDDEKDPHTGQYKGSFRIYELSDDGEGDRDLIYASVPTAGSIKIFVRLYALQAMYLATPSRVKDKTCDPYIEVTLGPKTISDTTQLEFFVRCKARSIVTQTPPFEN